MKININTDNKTIEVEEATAKELIEVLPLKNL